MQIRSGTAFFIYWSGSECDGLIAIKIPSGLTTGLDEAFAGSPQLLVTVDPENTRYRSKENGLYGLDGDVPVQLLHMTDGTAPVILPDTVTSLARKAFFGCESISSITLPDRLKTIGSMAFQGCTGLQEIVIPASVTEIGDLAFNKFGDADGAVCKVTVEADNKQYFSYDGGLYTSDGTLLYMPNQEIATLSPKAVKIGNNAFWANDQLRNVVIPDTVTEIGEQAFYACRNLKSIALPEGLTRISQRAFAGEPQAPCGLEEITIPNSVTYLGTRVFENCNALVTVGAADTEPTVPVLRTAALTAGEAAHKLDSVTFSNCPRLTTVEISAGITEIGANVFENCPNLKHIIIPAGVSTIDEAAFEGLGNFTIYGEEGSLAQEYANKNSIEFQPGEPEEEQPTPPSPGGPGGSEEPEVPEEPGKELPFADIGGHWASDAIQWVYANGVFQGVSDTRFAPEDSMERGMLALVLYRLAGKPAVQGESPYMDVTAGKYYTDAVIWASQQGVVSGVGDNQFAPLEPVSRQQIATMLYRYEQKFGTADETGDPSSFSDADQISDWAQEAMEWAIGAQVLKGDNGQLRPQDKATRAEVATIVQRRFVESYGK